MKRHKRSQNCWAAAPASNTDESDGVECKAETEELNETEKELVMLFQQREGGC